MKIKQTSSAGGIVVNTEGKFIIVQQKSGSWSLPKGHIDPGEEIEAAARREIYEESGVKDLQLVKDLGSYQRYKSGHDKSELKTIYMFLFKTSHAGPIKPIDKDNPQALWVTSDEAIELLTHQKDKEFFKNNHE